MAPVEQGALRAGADTEIAGRWLAGGDGEGGTGTAVGTVSCRESAFVARYQTKVEERVYARWDVPPNTPPGAEVVLRFRLAPSGSLTSVEFVRAASPALGESAVNAMRTAAPFPPHDANLGDCLTGNLLATFDVPSL